MQTKFFLSSIMNLEAARAFAASRDSHAVSNLPLRFRSVIIAAETEGFRVCDLGFAVTEQMEIIR